MAKKSKRLMSTFDNVDRTKLYPLDEAIALVKQTASAKFDESVDVAVNLGVEARKSDQSVRGSTVLPQGTGKTMKVAVFADGPDAEAATAAGADIVGMDDLAEKVQKGDFDFFDWNYDADTSDEFTFLCDIIHGLGHDIYIADHNFFGF